jgi:hypothetical protein
VIAPTYEVCIILTRTGAYRGAPFEAHTPRQAADMAAILRAEFPAPDYRIKIKLRVPAPFWERVLPGAANAA